MTLTSEAPAAHVDADLLTLIPPADELTALAEHWCPRYAENKPFPHVVLDDFLPVGQVERMLEAFPDPDTGSWFERDIPRERKLSSTEERLIPPPIRNALYAMNSATFLGFLEALTGVEGLIPDPYFLGGGMHQIVPGGKLEIHADFNKSPKLKLNRCLNLLLFLNKDWEDAFGGHLELWDGRRHRCEKRVLPIFNRCVIFSTTATSFHGHPQPLACPPGRSRKSVALYYYTSDRSRGQKAFGHGTEFLDYAREDTPSTRARVAARRIFRELTPPFLNKLTKRVLVGLGFDQ